MLFSGKPIYVDNKAVGPAGDLQPAGSEQRGKRSPDHIIFSRPLPSSLINPESLPSGSGQQVDGVIKYWIYYRSR